MSRILHRAVDRWLAYERRGRGDAADAALRRVFEALPLPAPAAGFVEQVMARAGLVPPRSVIAPGWRIAIAGALALAASAALTGPAIVGGLLRWVSPAEVLGLAAGAVVAACQRLAAGLALWQVAGTVGRTLAEALSSPALLAALLAAALMSAGGARLLYALVEAEPRSRHAR